MNLKVLAILLLYYCVLSAFFWLGSTATTGYYLNGSLDNSTISGDEVTTGGIFGAGVSFTRFLGFVTIGVGLPDSTPSWFAYLWSLISISILIFTIGFIVSSIWNG